MCLQAAFMLVDPKCAKKTVDQVTRHFTLLGSEGEKAASKMLVKLTL